MPININRDTQILTYAEARHLLEPVNPELCHEMDLLEVDNTYPLIKFRYHYGDKLLDKGDFLIPDGHGGLVFKDSSEADPRIRDLLGHDRFMSMMVPINGTLELFMDCFYRPVSHVLGSPGFIFGISGLFDQRTYFDAPIYWSICAGSRSVMMLPKISHNTHHAHLCRDFDLKIPLPDTVYDHFAIFKALAGKQEEPWSAEIIMFTRKWFEDKTAPRWKLFRGYLLAVWTEQYSYRLAGDIYTSFLTQGTEKFKPSPDLFNTVDHIIRMSQGSRLGYVIAKDEQSLPLHWLQQAFANPNRGYRLKDYTPEIMIPGYLNTQTPVYYSLPYPSRSDFFRANNQSTPKHHELVAVMDMLQHVQNTAILDQRSGLEAFKRLEKIRYQGIHFQDEEKSCIISTSTLAKQLTKTKKARDSFPVNSSFFCGAVQASIP